MGLGDNGLTAKKCKAVACKADKQSHFHHPVGLLGDLMGNLYQLRDPSASLLGGIRK